jgi:hypothetical protein
MKLIINLLLLSSLSFILRTSPDLGAASCLYECAGPLCYDFGNHTTLCQETRAKCEHSCSSQRSYGAIAYSAPEKGWGFSYGMNNQVQAENLAVKNCSAHGKSCESIVWYYNSCGAVAADGKIVTWGRNSVKATAEQTAMSECRKAGGKNCVVQTSQCSRG